MQVDLSGQVALVTGAGHGIGRAIAIALARNGADIAVNDLSGAAEDTVEVIHGLGRRAEFFAADVSDAAQVRSMAAAAEAAFGHIDILINNAGVGVSGQFRDPIDRFDEGEWKRIIDIDLNGVYFVTRAISPGMAARKRGAIVCIASVMGMVPIRKQIPYAAAKAGVINFARSAALELAPHGVRVNAIAPGSTLTRGTEALFYNPDNKALAESLLSHVPLGRPGSCEEIAAATVFLASPDASYITGTVLAVDGGWTAGFARDW